MTMDGARNQFLASAVLARDQHIGVGARDLLDVGDDLAHATGLADDAFGIAGVQVVQRALLAAQLPSLRDRRD